MIKTYNPDFKNTILQKLERQSFINFIGFQITNIAEGLIEGELDLEERHLQSRGIVHGGVIATIADTAIGFAATTLVPKDCAVVTAELKVSYLNPGIGTKLLAKGWVLKQGKNLNFCEAEVFCINKDNVAVLIAKASASMATVSPE
ncbi:PaaI family thioesterase [Adhaeribacter aquaticus]|uniref:PaaI family thioesterase n=1 Tax=Adhaeribacter aquaticus TaxID=299567 RepID=UPI000479C2AF|nr:PaaI family thioesterase [Adhaeribacter aquaticus]